MKLNDFKQYVDKVIVSRGHQYYREGQVESLEVRRGNNYVAVVAGSHEYEVKVQLDKQSEIIAAECDCPYIDGPYCKHMVAVFFALREDDRQMGNDEICDIKVKDIKGMPVKNNPNNELKQELSRQSKENLIKFLLSLAEDNSIIADQIKAEFSSGTGEKEKWIKLMKRYIDEAEDDDGFINWRNCHYAVEGAYKVLERAQTAVYNQEYEFAVDLALCVMGEMIDMLQFADDSAGDIGTVIDEVRQLFTTLVDEISEDKIIEACFSKILSEAQNARYSGWTDCRMDLLRVCAELSVTGQHRKRLEECLQRILTGSAKQSHYDFYNKHEAEEIALLRYELVQKFDGKKAAAEFLWENRAFSRFRELALEKAMAANDCTTAEELALEGEKQDKELPGLVKRWKECRFKIYQRQQKLDNMRKVCRELMLFGEFGYYQQLKTLYDATEWQRIYPDLLDVLATKSGYANRIYTDAVIAEKEWGRLLEYVRQNPYKVLDFYQHLLVDYRLQVYEILNKFILQEAARSNERSGYKRVCSYLRLLVKIGGNDMAAELIKYLTLEYTRRPAFREELQKVKVK